MKKILLTSAVLLGTATVASAADLSAPPVADAMVSGFTWSGFYVGVHGGANRQDQDIQRGEFSGSVFPNPNLYPDFNPDLGSQIGEIFPSGFGSSNETGFMGGAQGGYNQQFGMFVLGVEADISYLANQRVDYSSVHAFTAENVDVTEAVGEAEFDTDLDVRHQMDWLGTARLRAGVALDRFMVYGTAGLAFGKPDHQVDFTAALTATGGPAAPDGIDFSGSFSGRNNDWEAGWTAGVGAEYAFTDKVTIKVEYLYYDLGSTTVTADSSTSGLTIPYDFDNKGDITRVGLNYRF